MNIIDVKRGESKFSTNAVYYCDSISNNNDIINIIEMFNERGFNMSEGLINYEQDHTTYYDDTKHYYELTELYDFLKNAPFLEYDTVELYGDYEGKKSVLEVNPQQNCIWFEVAKKKEISR